MRREGARSPQAPGARDGKHENTNTEHKGTLPLASYFSRVFLTNFFQPTQPPPLLAVKNANNSSALAA